MVEREKLNFGKEQLPLSPVDNWNVLWRRMWSVRWTVDLPEG
jgi:hypothetical protein